MTEHTHMNKALKILLRHLISEGGTQGGTHGGGGGGRLRVSE
jgi:hypothetical protein